MATILLKSVQIFSAHPVLELYCFNYLTVKTDKSILGMAEKSLQNVLRLRFEFPAVLNACGCISVTCSVLSHRTRDIEVFLISCNCFSVNFVSFLNPKS